MTEVGRRWSERGHLRWPVSRNPFDAILSVSPERQNASGVGRPRGRHWAIRPLSSDLRHPISDIVKRKRIRSRAGWGETFVKRAVRFGERDLRFAFILPFEQPVVGLEPDRSDPRMRLKQNWSFQCQRAFRRSEARDQRIGTKACPIPDRCKPITESALWR